VRIWLELLLQLTRGSAIAKEPRISLISTGSLLQSHGRVTWNDLSPSCGPGSRHNTLVYRSWRCPVGCIGTRWQIGRHKTVLHGLQHQCIRSLKATERRTGSQCNGRMTGVMLLIINLTAVFCTDYSRSKNVLSVRTELQ